MMQKIKRHYNGEETVQTQVPSLDRRIFFPLMQRCVGKRLRNLYLYLFLFLFLLSQLKVLRFESDYAGKEGEKEREEGK
jgi:hypothetical protein